MKKKRINMRRMKKPNAFLHTWCWRLARWTRRCLECRVESIISRETDSEYKAAYLRYMVNVAKLFNADEDAAVRNMKEVLHFEEQLANVSRI